VHDRALLYFRLMATDLGEAQRVVCASKGADVPVFIEDSDLSVRVRPAGGLVRAEARG
jgi:hypothetical protein